MKIFSSPTKTIFYNLYNRRFNESMHNILEAYYSKIAKGDFTPIDYATLRYNATHIEMFLKSSQISTEDKEKIIKNFEENYPNICAKINEKVDPEFFQKHRELPPKLLKLMEGANLKSVANTTRVFTPPLHGDGLREYLFSGVRDLTRENILESVYFLQKSTAELKKTMK